MVIGTHSFWVAFNTVTWNVEDFRCFSSLKNVDEIPLSQYRALKDASIESFSDGFLYWFSLLNKWKLRDRFSNFTHPRRFFAENKWGCEKKPNVSLLSASIPIYGFLALQFMQELLQLSVLLNQFSLCFLRLICSHCLLSSHTMFEIILLWFYFTQVDRAFSVQIECGPRLSRNGIFFSHFFSFDFATAFSIHFISMLCLALSRF